MIRYLAFVAPLVCTLVFADFAEARGRKHRHHCSSCYGGYSYGFDYGYGGCAGGMCGTVIGPEKYGGYYEAPYAATYDAPPMAVASMEPTVRLAGPPSQPVIRYYQARRGLFGWRR